MHLIHKHKKYILYQNMPKNIMSYDKIPLICTCFFKRIKTKQKLFSVVSFASNLDWIPSCRTIQHVYNSVFSEKCNKICSFEFSKCIINMKSFTVIILGLNLMTKIALFTKIKKMGFIQRHHRHRPGTILYQIDHYDVLSFP